MELAARQWKAFTYNTTKTEQENAGFSHTPAVQEAINKLKNGLLKYAEENVPRGSRVLDIGCGPGIYLELLKHKYELHGIDVSEQMTARAKELLPRGTFYTGNFLNLHFATTFNLIYSISVIEYVPVSQLKNFFNKCHDLLEPGGYIFIQYPHALKRSDLFYPDRNYINYSPAAIQSACSGLFDIILHQQFYDGRKIASFDRQPYPTPSKDFRNGYLLIARKHESA